MKTRNEQITDFLTSLDTEIDLQYLCSYIDTDGLTFDMLTEEIDNQDLFNQDVIYYSVAMDYLNEHDNSLTESMAIASELGYTTDNINSELLASLLASQKCRKEWYNLEDEITDFLDELELMEDEELI